jgi:hypothetical protein
MWYGTWNNQSWAVFLFLVPSTKDLITKDTLPVESFGVMNEHSNIRFRK